MTRTCEPGSPRHRDSDPVENSEEIEVEGWEWVICEDCGADTRAFYHPETGVPSLVHHLRIAPI